MTLHRGTTTLALLGLLAGFVNIDAFRLNPIPSAGLSSAPSSTQRTSAVCKHGKASSAWRTAHRGLSMSTLSALDDVSATDEVDEAPSQTNVMDELDAILGDAKTVSKSTRVIWNVHDKVDACARIASVVALFFVIRSGLRGPVSRGVSWPIPPRGCLLSLAEGTSCFSCMQLCSTLAAYAWRWLKSWPCFFKVLL